MKKNPSSLEAMRHSCEHVLTQAVLTLYPTVKMAMGPATDDGFYFDFDSGGLKISEEDFPKIEAVMAEIIKANLPFKKEEMGIKQARKLFEGNPYKQEWLDEVEEKREEAIIYHTGDQFTDLCGGPHLESTGQIGPFKLLSVAGAYWRGSEKNKMLTRIYGTCFTSQKELDQYLSLKEEAKKNDHRKLGKELGLFIFSDLVGKGLPLFTKKGATIKRELENFIIAEEIKRGYQHVSTPELAKTALYEKSGHYPYYKDSMYPPMIVDDDELILRPMSCPHHFQLFSHRPRSYRELPMRIAELAKLFRYEKSGELSGLMRVRSFCLADAHIICTQEQAAEEVRGALDLIEYIAGCLGLKKGQDYHYRLAVGDRKNKEKFYQDDQAWEFAENLLRKILTQDKQAWVESPPGEAAFYGPKIDIEMENTTGKRETAFTVQYDFVMSKRFDLAYIDQDGKKREPVVIHRSSIGAIERTLALLIERFAGALPVWLAPIQVNLVPIADRHLEYAKSVAQKLIEVGIRAEIDTHSETTSAKIRNAEMQKVPYILVVGDREEEGGKVNIRGRGKKDLGEMVLAKFITLIKEDIAEKR